MFLAQASIIIAFTDGVASEAGLLGKPVALIASSHFASLANDGVLG